MLFIETERQKIHMNIVEEESREDWGVGWTEKNQSSCKLRHKTFMQYFLSTFSLKEFSCKTGVVTELFVVGVVHAGV